MQNSDISDIFSLLDEQRQNKEKSKKIKQSIKEKSLLTKIIPKHIQRNHDIKLSCFESLTEQEITNNLALWENNNHFYPNLIGQGYYDTILPDVIKKNILKNPLWYETPLLQHDELHQGKLEILLTFQQMIQDLTKMDIAGIGLSDEVSASAEALILMRSINQNKKRNILLIDQNCYPQNITVTRTYAYGLGVNIIIGDPKKIINQYQGKFFGLLIQYPGTNGEIPIHIEEIIHTVHKANAMVAVSADLLSLTLLKPPGEMNADIVFGSIQRFGIPLGFGGPHAAYFTCQSQYKNLIPTSCVHIDSNKQQHLTIKHPTQDKIHSPSLIAIMIATLYAMHHGSNNLINIAKKVHLLARFTSGCVNQMKHLLINKYFFDTISFVTYNPISHIDKKKFHIAITEFYEKEKKIVIAINEKTTVKDIIAIFSSISNPQGNALNPVFLNIKQINNNLPIGIPKKLRRTSTFLTQESFIKYQSIQEMSRYLKQIINKDMIVQQSIMPIGGGAVSIKTIPKNDIWLNEKFSSLHPLISSFAPSYRSTHYGYAQLLSRLHIFLCEMTGFNFVFISTNTALQAEYTACMCIRSFFEDENKKNQKNICLIPSYLQNIPRSIIISGLTPIKLSCDHRGFINLQDLNKKIKLYKNKIAMLWFMFPSVYGTLDFNIQKISDRIHRIGGQIFVDASQLNSINGYINLEKLGIDICQINISNLLNIPHTLNAEICVLGVQKHLIPYVPKHHSVYFQNLDLIYQNLLLSSKKNNSLAFSQITSTLYGSASLLTLAWVYAASLGIKGLQNNALQSIINANYLANRLKQYFSIHYTNKNHLIVNYQFLIEIKLAPKSEITIIDVAKRLIDYGFHAPKIFIQKNNTFFIELTANDSKEEIDQFCDSLIQIHKEITNITEGKTDKKNNLLKNAPHTIDMLLSEKWNLPYSKEEAFFPLPWIKTKKYWPPVTRIKSRIS